jgi:5-(carboxyamino)imidazole ribonucleotide synthase
MPQVIQPGSVIGLLGGGQLGRMTALAAKNMGYQVVVLAPDACVNGMRSPAGQLADHVITAAYEDANALRQLADRCDVITQEFENIPSQALQQLVDWGLPVHPSPNVLHVGQHRLREKTWLAQAGFPLTPFYAIPNHACLDSIPANCFPGVLKTAGFGYDGKGQQRVKNRFDAAAAFEKLGGQPCVLEQWVNLAGEISVIGARNHTGFAHFGVMENVHKHHILSVTQVPATLPEPLKNMAIQLTQHMMDMLDVIGLLCVEFFVTHDGQLLINEMAPRPHNSGHITQNAFATSQFEQHVRAICGLPLGDTTLLYPVAAMVNILGDSWVDGQAPDWPDLMARVPSAKLHLYGKTEARLGRKMGHINLCATTPDQLTVMLNQTQTLLNAIKITST